MTTPQAPAPRKNRPTRRATVTAKETLSPHLIRITARCDALASGELTPTEHTDAYVKIELTDADGDTVLRTYTIRAWRPETHEIVLDFVVHGDEGLAGPWAVGVEVGDEFTFRGPGGGYAPDVETPGLAHLLVGDLSSLPAIEAALERIPAGRAGQVVIALDDAADRRELASELPVEWVVSESLTEAYQRAVTYVRGWEPPAGTELEVFVHGEAAFVRELRRHLRVDRGVAKERQSISGYWKRGRVDEQWRQEKRDWAQPVDEAEAALAG